MKQGMVAWVALSVLLTACGKSGSGVEPTGPDSLPPESPGAQCLEEAAASRTPRADAPSKIRVSHILVRHAALARPEGATRSKEEACLRALQALDHVKQSGDWEGAVTEYSESGQSTGGDLGSVGREELEGPFGNAAFALEVDELSYVVESDRGFHIILRTE